MISICEEPNRFTAVRFFIEIPTGNAGLRTAHLRSTQCDASNRPRDQRSSKPVRPIRLQTNHRTTDREGHD
jgi:hypothetical protein